LRADWDMISPWSSVDALIHALIGGHDM